MPIHFHWVEMPQPNLDAGNGAGMKWLLVSYTSRSSKAQNSAQGAIQ